MVFSWKLLLLVSLCLAGLRCMRLTLGQGAVRLVHQRVGDLREHSDAEVHLPCEHMSAAFVNVRRRL